MQARRQATYTSSDLYYMHVPVCDGDELSFFIGKEKKLAEEELRVKDKFGPNNRYSEIITTCN